jgi:hypothetical protein
LCPAIIERVYREPLGEILFEKMMGRKRRNGAHVYVEPFGGVAMVDSRPLTQVFHRVCLKSIT